MSAKIEIPFQAFASWYATGERGLSSEFIASYLSGARGVRVDHPHDPSDFRRCQLLLEAVPLARLALGQMRSASPVWARLVDEWDNIHAAMEAEVPGYLTGARGSAHIGYKLMRRVIDGGVPCHSCRGTGRAEACAKCKGAGRRSGGRCRAANCVQGYHACFACRGAGYTTGRAA